MTVMTRARWKTRTETTDAFRDKINRDFKTNHGRVIFEIIRGDRPKPLTELPYEVKTHATMCRTSKGHATLMTQQDVQLAVGHPATIGMAEVQIIEQRGRHIEAKVLAGQIPTTGTIVQQRIASTPDEISRQIHKFWGAIWNRETTEQETDEQEWKKLQDELDTVSIPKELAFTPDFDDEELWQHTIHQLKSYKAAGGGQKNSNSSHCKQSDSSSSSQNGS